MTNKLLRLFWVVVLGIIVTLMAFSSGWIRIFINPDSEQKLPSDADTLYISGPIGTILPEILNGDYKIFDSDDSALTKIIIQITKDLPLNGGAGSLINISYDVDKLKLANISFNTPETMKVSETKTIILLMSQGESIQQLTQAIDKQISEPGKIHGDTVKISTIMEASLTGQGFLINAITPVRQLVSGFDRNMWKWDVTAKETGEKKLHLTLNALISNGKNKELHTIKTYERTVLVYVRFGDKILAFLGGNWQFLFGAIVSPLVIYFWRKTIGRKKSV